MLLLLVSNSRLFRNCTIQPPKGSVTNGWTHWETINIFYSFNNFNFCLSDDLIKFALSIPSTRLPSIKALTVNAPDSHKLRSYEWKDVGNVISKMSGLRNCRLLIIATPDDVGQATAGARHTKRIISPIKTWETRDAILTWNPTFKFISQWPSDGAKDSTRFGKNLITVGNLRSLSMKCDFSTNLDIYFPERVLVVIERTIWKGIKPPFP
ncbi:uncharacterized protein BDR25DRAFT_351158 [Lindgomyces ingoldianus]|uniref:Uncharacterized protein n=1 Tax=Lindgomyces ingoldianus TaxID=673940 RepID=A0ACB6R5N6_9PLEO|nr:uncharacterized protein BDR25DRAFT_351158 [Lindgomyces ingoldianus]KAF2474619.1 hypothetical protein BDR25DRAFT_351158 [Lindgomyces ingoldianus]